MQEGAKTKMRWTFVKRSTGQRGVPFLLSLKTETTYAVNVRASGLPHREGRREHSVHHKSKSMHNHAAQGFKPANLNRSLIEKIKAKQK